jgi:hypothetical protein
MRSWRSFCWLVVVATLAMCSACNQTPVAPNPALEPASPRPIPPDAVLVLSSFETTFTPNALRATFTLRETAGGDAVLESMRLDESGGRSDYVDAWCWGDAGVKVAANSTFESSVLGYCAPVIQTPSPGASVTMTLVYRTTSDHRVTLQVSAPVQK